MQSNQIAEATSMPTIFPFDARLHVPTVKPVPTMPTIDEIPIVDQRDRDREEVKQNLQSIMRNRLLSETARVAAARELTRIFDNEEISELRQQVELLKQQLSVGIEDSDGLPAHLRVRG
jgi:hypothetical protein